MKSLQFILIVIMPFFVFGSEMADNSAYLLSILSSAFESKDNSMALIIAIMFMTGAFKKFALPKDGSKDKTAPFISAGLGAAAGASISAATGQGDISTSALGGILLGNTASGLYSMAVKPVKKKFKKKVSSLKKLF